MHGAIPPHTQYACMAWCLVKHGDNFISSAEYNSSVHEDQENVKLAEILKSENKVQS